MKQSHTAYELCADRTCSGRIAMFGECVVAFLRQSAKGAPQWTKGIWLGKTTNNDVNIVAVPGNNELFVIRSIRRFPNAWNGNESGVDLSLAVFICFFRLSTDSGQENYSSINTGSIYSSSFPG